MQSPLDGRRFVPQPIRGWRLFRVVTKRARSMFVAEPEAWWDLDDHDWHRAVCRKSVNSLLLAVQQPTHEAPLADCQCGFYAWRSRVDVVLDLVKTEPQWMPELVALVEGAGRVILHERGWRASDMRIVRWWPAPSWLRRVGPHLREECFAPEPRGAYQLLLRYLDTVGARSDCQHCGVGGCWGVRTHGFVCKRCLHQTAASQGCWYDWWLRDRSKED